MQTSLYSATNPDSLDNYIKLLGWQHTVAANTHFTLPSTRGVTVHVFVIGPMHVIIQRSSLTVTLWRKLMSMGKIIIVMIHTPTLLVVVMHLKVVFQPHSIGGADKVGTHQKL